MLFYLLIGVTLLILGGAMCYAYSTTRDPLHPLIYLAPLCIYSYAFKPALLSYMDAINAFFDDRQVLFVEVVNVIGVAAFCLGALYHAHQVARMRVGSLRIRADLERLLTPAVRRRVLEIALLLAGLAGGMFWLMVVSTGGLSVAYGDVKGGVRTSSGYLNEIPMLCLPAIGLLYLAWAGTRFTAGRVLTLLVVASPLIIHGVLGARRGPTFMVFGALLIGGFLVASRRPSLITVFVTIFCLGVLMLFLVNNRQRIYLGSGAIEEWSSGSSRDILRNVDVGDDWIHSGGTIVTSHESGIHYWGSRVFVYLLIRPIPKQIWPDKYFDTGFGWMEDRTDMLGMTDTQWVSAVGWIPARGAAAGLVADLYLEFAWLGLAGCWLIGWIYSWLWMNMVLKRGVWFLLYLYAAILSVYVPTQNVTDAWAYRMILLCVPTFLLWHVFVQPILEQPSRMVRSAGPQRMSQPHQLSLSRRQRLRSRVQPNFPAGQDSA